MAEKSGTMGGKGGVLKSSIGAGTSHPSQSRHQPPTPSPPPNEQSPQLGAAPGEGARSSREAEQQASSRAVPLHMSGMRAAQSLAEWQLQAVLFRARLTQYFEVFISQGGDDIDQIMQCDEAEFLEIMSLVGMASKPLHVRRLQRTLSEFSLSRAQFLIGTVPFIGLPSIDFPSTSSTDNLTAILQFLIPGYLPAGGQMELGAGHQPPSIGPDFLFPLGPHPPLVNQTFSDQLLRSLVNPPVHDLPYGSTKRSRMSSFSPPSTPKERGGEGGASSSSRMEMEEAEGPKRTDSGGGEEQQAAFSPSSSSPSADHLTKVEIARLGQLARELVEHVPAKLEPRTGQGKRRMERGLLEAISLPPEDPLRVEHFRLFARIYGRFDAKRRPDKALTRHERIVNEAAAQLSLLRPDLLARRDELFPLARKLARMFEMAPGMFGGRGGCSSTGLEPASPERSCSVASSTAESAVETPREREGEGADEDAGRGASEE